MSIYFSKYIFFLWYFFHRNIKVLSKKRNELIIQTELKKLTLKKNKKSLKQYVLIKYIPILFFLFLTISIQEIMNLDLIIILAPLFIILNLLFFPYRRVVIPISICAALIIFIFYDILVLPLFIKYLIVSYIFIEIYLDIFKREIYYVFEEDNNQKPVAFAIQIKE